MSKMYVIGIGFRPLDKKASYIVQHSDVVLANSRLVEVFKKYSEYDSVKERFLVHGSVYETLDYISANYQKKKLSLLAAGDPMFFGIGRLVIERLGKDAVEVFPDLSSIQAAFSRVRETSNNALLISLHGGPDPEKRRKPEYELSDVPGLLKSHNKIAVLTDKVNSPEAIAGTICKGEGTLPLLSLKMYVCENLGYDDEKVTEGTPEELSKMSFGHPNVVIIVQNTEDRTQNSEKEARSAVSSQQSEIKFGIKESEIQHSKGLITKDEVRAVAIHKLRLPQTGVLWDIGAGSGSVSIEAAIICPDLKIYSIEKDEEQLTNITENKNRLLVDNIEIVGGHAPEALMQLPAPDRVFIGGSSGRLSEIIKVIESSYELRITNYELNAPSLIIVINAATIETLNEALQVLEKNGFKIDVSEISVSRSKVIGGKRHMSALNPVFVITGEKNLK
ncbi:MAG: precorrin-6y C5,15-methyltransferase (decarboxylating) subunit CbiE [Nitrospiraceae bacterium]|nr:MAG: precorrin-6y C5,15-methyltransferase (decarboxylating) subunit CbiE [Nitrospiraceae bacterium]